MNFNTVLCAHLIMSFWTQAALDSTPTNLTILTALYGHLVALNNNITSLHYYCSLSDGAECTLNIKC